MSHTNRFHSTIVCSHQLIQRIPSGLIKTMTTHQYRLATLLAAVSLATGFNAATTQAQDVDLVIDFNTGATTIVNNEMTTVNISGYSITSPDGALLDAAGRTSLQSQFGASGFELTANQSAMGLAEISAGGSIPIASGASLDLGAAFSGFQVNPTAINAAAQAAGFGNGFIDIDFQFGNDDNNALVAGNVVVNNLFTNNLVLQANSETGAGLLINDSAVPVTIDFLQVTSDLDGMNSPVTPFIPANFGALPGFDSTSPSNSDSQLVQLFVPSGLDPTEGFEIAAGASVNLGDFFDAAGLDLGEEGALDAVFRVVGEANGRGAVEQIVGLVGDYNADGRVDVADYAVWRDNLGTSFQLANEDPTQSPGFVGDGDFDVWLNNFGATAASGGVAVGVPEPTTSLLLIAALALPLVRRS